MSIYKNNWLHFLITEEGEKKVSKWGSLLHCLILTSTLPPSGLDQGSLQFQMR